MQKTLRLLVDRRSGEDRRKIYNRGYFRSGGDEYSGEVAMLFRSKSPLYSGIMRHPPVGA